MTKPMDDSLTTPSHHPPLTTTRAPQGSTTPAGGADEVCPKWIRTGSVRHVSTQFWIVPSSIQLGSLLSSSLPSLATEAERRTRAAMRAA